ncbi:MAG: redoxin domain-containing protein [Promethearchaeota archaeon]
MARKLKINDDAPDFEIQPVNQDGILKLAELIATKPVLLVFSRFFGCPVCQWDFDNLLENINKIQEKVHVIYVAQSSPESIKDFIKDKEITFSIVSDDKPPYPLYKKYLVGNLNLITLSKMAKIVLKRKYKHGKNEGNNNQSPADFIISQDKKILHANYSLLNLNKVFLVLGSL